MVILKLLGKFLLGALGLVLLYLLLGFGLSLIPVGGRDDDKDKTRRFYISSNGVHTDLIFHRDDVPAALRKGMDFFAAYDYWAFGWGDKGFYLDTPTWAELKVSTAVEAMLLPSPTAMHVTGYRAVGKDWVTDTISDQQLAELATYIYDSFERTTEGYAQLIENAAYGDDDQFFEAQGNYNAVYTCNNWVNEGLKAAGVRTALWSPSEWGVMRWREKVVLR